VPLRVQIVTNTLNPVSALIRFTTKGWASHAEMVDTDRGITLGARAWTFRYKGGLQIRESKYDHYSKVEQFVLNSPNSPELLQDAWDWLYQRIGTPYNYRGCFGIATNLMLTNPKAMDCSHAIFAATWLGADFPLLSTRPSNLPWRITPQALLGSRGLVYVPTLP